MSDGFDRRNTISINASCQELFLIVSNREVEKSVDQNKLTQAEFKTH
jgi:hypothetical protein